MVLWLALLSVDLSRVPPTPMQDRLGAASCLLTVLCLCCPGANLPCLHILHSFTGTSPLYYEIGSIYLKIKRGQGSA